MELDKSVGILLALEVCALMCFVLAFAYKRKIQRTRHRLLASTKSTHGELARKYTFLKIARWCLVGAGIVITVLVCYVVVMAATTP